MTTSTARSGQPNIAAMHAPSLGAASEGGPSSSLKPDAGKSTPGVFGITSDADTTHVTVGQPGFRNVRQCHGDLMFELAVVRGQNLIVARYRSAALAQPLHLCFQLREARFTLGDRRGDICCLEALRDMLRTVRIPGRNGEQDHLLGASTIARRHQSCGQLAIAFNDAGSTPYFDTLTLGVVDEEQVGLGIVG